MSMATRQPAWADRRRCGAGGPGDQCHPAGLVHPVKRSRRSPTLTNDGEGMAFSLAAYTEAGSGARCHGAGRSSLE